MRIELVTTLKRNAIKIIAKIEADQTPVLITQRGRPAAYLMAVNAFEALQERVHPSPAVNERTGNSVTSILTLPCGSDCNCPPMDHQIPLSSATIATGASQASAGGAYPLAPDLAFKTFVFVNIAFIGVANAGDRQWVLVDAAIPATAGAIASAAASRFGENSRPSAILLTHGHFDHVGALKDLAEKWECPIYAHPLEMPYLDGRASYPPADPSVGGGLMARLSSLYPTGPVDVSQWLEPLPADSSVPTLPGWRWLHTPGHSPGHVSFWRESDRSLIVGDAFVTTKAESAYEANFAQEPEMHGPPQYFTPDWASAKGSVTALADLEPNLVLTGHGQPLQGAEMRAALRRLAQEFESIAVPEHGRYVLQPAQADASGPTYIPPKS